MRTVGYHTTVHSTMEHSFFFFKISKKECEKTDHLAMVELLYRTGLHFEFKQILEYIFPFKVHVVEYGVGYSWVNIS